MLKQDEANVLLGQAGFVERAHEEDVRIGAAGNRDPSALEIGDIGDLAVFAGDQRGPFGARENADGLDRIAVDLADQSGRAGGRANVERTGIEEFERLVGAGRKNPADVDLVLLEFLFEKLLLADDQRERIIGGVIDADFRDLRKSRGRGGNGERKARGNGLATGESEHGSILRNGPGAVR